jgi:hypothetical protein
MKWFEYLENEYKRIVFIELKENFSIAAQAESQVVAHLDQLYKKWLRFLAYFKVMFKYLKCKLLNKFPEMVDLQALLLKEKQQNVVPGPQIPPPPADVVPKT